MVSFIFQTKGGQLDVIQLDAALTANHSADAEVTEHKIETGSNIADHIVVKPKQLRIDGLIVDFPLPGQAGGFGPGSLGFKGRAATLYAQLEALQASGTPIEVRTSLKTYERMVLKGLSAPQDKATKGAVKFSASLHEVRFVDTVLVPVEVTRVNAAKSERDMGTQTTTPATEAERDKSILLNIIDKFVVNAPPSPLVKPGVK